MNDLILGMCGDNCFYCHRYIATKSGCVEDLEKVKELWVRLDLRGPDFPVQRMACDGCTPENRCAYVKLCTCVYEKEIENCGYCDEYPCGLINEAFDKSESLKDRAICVCTQEEMELLNKAFFSKKDHFDHIQQEYRAAKLKCH